MEPRRQNTEEPFDIIVIGAGINGAGIARDAAMRGLRVLLLDKGDLGGATTAWSTRLIHGGLRYLEHGELRLVSESLREREILLRVAPHLVRSLPILIPIYAHKRRSPWVIRAGMIAYDLLSLGKTLPRHRMLSRLEALQRVPSLSRENLLGAAVYYDGQVEFPERLVVENVLSAQANGATVLSYARVDGFIMEGGALRGVNFANELSGERRRAHGHLVINATGPWVDQILLNTGNSPCRLIGGTKGSHLVVAPFSGAPSLALYAEAGKDQRPFFVIPWNDNYLIGTTDIRYGGDLDEVVTDNEEVEYLLRETNRLIPEAQLGRESILFSYSGIRPLAFTKDQDEQSITRRHFIRQHAKPSGLISIVGGKLTTYRRVAEQAVDLVCRKLGKNVPRSTTAEAPLPGAGAVDFDIFKDNFKKDCGLSQQTSERLLRIYGVRAADVIALAHQDQSLLQIIDSETGGIAAEVVFSFRQEMAQTLADCLLRRTMIGLNSSCGLNAVEAVATVAEKHLGWSRERAAQQIAVYRSYIERFRSSFSAQVKP